jgi:hypothetical protein
LASLGTADEDIYEEIKNVLYTDSVVAGEATGISMGLLMVGTGSDKANEMLAHLRTRDTTRKNYKVKMFHSAIRKPRLLWL